MRYIYICIYFGRGEEKEKVVEEEEKYVCVTVKVCDYW